MKKLLIFLWVFCMSFCCACDWIEKDDGGVVTPPLGQEDEIGGTERPEQPSPKPEMPDEPNSPKEEENDEYAPNF